MNVILDAHWHVYAVAGVLVALLFYFFTNFVTPAKKVSKLLTSVYSKIESDNAPFGQDLGKYFAGDENLRHLWAEFSETLHPIRDVNPETGIEELIALRATIPAETFFSDNALVDHHVKAEFFKHLPGIFTGVGIIGTFAGLLYGLSQFTVSADPNVARQSLDVLLRSVTEAFVVSGVAIMLAMVVTFFEKQILVGLYGDARRLTQAIDERFKAGVGEEYLARLVGASEQSATHSAHLKDALVGDLKAILSELTERQIRAMSESNVALGKQITDSVTGALAQPLEKLATATESVRGDQGQAVQQLVADLLTQFSSRVEGLFGDQLTGISQLQQQTIESLQEAVKQLREMASTVEGAGQRASSALAEKMTESIEKIDSRQRELAEELQRFVTETRKQVESANEEAQKKTRELVNLLSSNVSDAVTKLSSGSEAAVGAMSTQVNEMSARLIDAVAQMANAVERLESVSIDAINRMVSGADSLAIAADDFAKAGQGVTGVLDRTQVFAGQLSKSSEALLTAGEALQSLLRDYQTTRDVTARMMDVLKQSIESAKREATLTSDVLQRIEGSAAKLASAQQDADEYLGKVTEVLAAAHQSFADSVNRTLNSGNREFVDTISRATKMLGETIQELESALNAVSPNGSEARRSR